MKDRRRHRWDSDNGDALCAVCEAGRWEVEDPDEALCPVLAMEGHVFNPGTGLCWKCRVHRRYVDDADPGCAADLRRIVDGGERRPPFLGVGTSARARVVVEVVAAECGLPVKMIRSRSRRRLVCAARREVYRRLHAEGWSSVAIGREFDRDHSTILHALATAPAAPPMAPAPIS